MSDYANRSAYVKSPWHFAVRDNPVPAPAAGQLLIEIKACGVCGTDQHIADRAADVWQPFGHEVAGEVKAVGEGVPIFKVGDRVAVDSSAPCGTCATCAPPPLGRGRPDLCPKPLDYWLSITMGFDSSCSPRTNKLCPSPNSCPLILLRWPSRWACALMLCRPRRYSLVITCWSSVPGRFGRGQLP